jgi:hypothetical protein
MNRFGFSVACLLLYLLTGSAQAQHATLVHEAARLNFDDQADDTALEKLNPALNRDSDQVQSNHWLLTDATIDAQVIEFEVPVVSGEAIEVVELASECSCGQSHCHGVCRDPGHPRKPLLTKPGDRDQGDCPPLRYRMDDCQRAGKPHCYHRWAKCSIDDKYSAWFVGGGSPFPTARPRTSSEGTWGLDYGGLFGHNKVWLNYTRGRKQGGEGAYRTDGEPKIIKRAHELLHLGHQ